MIAQAHCAGRLRWQDLLLSRLTERTKLVGPTISCESSPKGGNVNGEWRRNPHIQSVFAMDKVSTRVTNRDVCGDCRMSRSMLAAGIQASSSRALEDQAP